MAFLWSAAFGGSTSSASSDAANREVALISIEKIIERMKTASQMDEIRAAIKGLKGFSRPYPLEVGSLAIRPLLATIVGAIRTEVEEPEARHGRHLLGAGPPPFDSDDDTSLYPAIDDTETLLDIIKLLYYLCRPRDAPEFKSNVVPFAEIIMKEESDIHALLHLLSLNHDLELRHQLLLFLELLLDYDAYRLTEILLSSPLAISHLVALLGEPQDMLRDTALMLLAKLTQGQHHELQKIVAFQGAFDRALNVVENEGGLSGSRAVDDALALIGNLVARNPTNQRYFREIGGDQRLLLLFRSTLSGANWNSQEPHLDNQGQQNRSEHGDLNGEIAIQLGTLFLGHIICKGLLVPLATPSTLLSQSALGVNAPLPFLTLLFDALKASVSLAWTSMTTRSTTSLNLRPLSYIQPELIVGVLETIGHLIYQHPENQAYFLTHTAAGWGWDVHLALIATSPILSLTVAGGEAVELAIRDAALFIFASLGDSLLKTISRCPENNTSAINDTAVGVHTNEGIHGIAADSVGSFFEAEGGIPGKTVSVPTPISIAVQILVESEWEGSSLWPVHYATNILIAYLHHAQNSTELRESLIPLIGIDSNQLAVPTRGVDSRSREDLLPAVTNPTRQHTVFGSTVSLIHLVMAKFLRPSHINLSVLKGDPGALRVSQKERAGIVVCKSLFALLIHLGNLHMEALFEAFASEQGTVSTANLHMLVEWISPTFDATLLGGLAAFLFSQLLYSAALLDRLWDSENPEDHGSQANSVHRRDAHILMELLHVRVGIDAVASRLALLQQHLFSRFPGHAAALPALLQESGPANPAFLDASTVEIIRRSMDDIQEFLRASQRRVQAAHQSTCVSLPRIQRSPRLVEEAHLSNLPLHVREVLSASERSTQALIAAKEQMIIERDTRIAEQCAAISEQRVFLEQATEKIAELSAQISSLEESRLRVISKLEGQLESLTSSYTALRREHDQLLILLTDLTSPKGMSTINGTSLAPLEASQAPSEKLFSPSQRTMAKEADAVDAPSPTPQKTGALASVIPLLWKMVPTPIQNHLGPAKAQHNSSTDSNKAIVETDTAPMPVSVNGSAQNHMPANVHAIATLPVNGADNYTVNPVAQQHHLKVMPVSPGLQNDRPIGAQPFPLDHCNGIHERFSSYIPIAETSSSINYPAGTYVEPPPPSIGYPAGTYVESPPPSIGYPVGNYVKPHPSSDIHPHSAAHDAYLSFSSPLEPMTTMPPADQMPSNKNPDPEPYFSAPPGTIHPYYLHMNYHSVSFEDSLGFVPQPESD